jgi:hypothetical protein
MSVGLPRDADFADLRRDGDFADLLRGADVADLADLTNGGSVVGWEVARFAAFLLYNGR